jgi:hypothetical protein
MKFLVKAPNETLLGEATLNPQDGLDTFGCFRRTSSGGKMLPPEGAAVGLRSLPCRRSPSPALQMAMVVFCCQPLMNCRFLRELDRLRAARPHPYSRIERQGTGDAPSTNSYRHFDPPGTQYDATTRQSREAFSP